MSIRSEQYRALQKTRRLLFDLIDSRATPGVPRDIRRRASDAVKHFPFLEEDGEPMFSQDSVRRCTHGVDKRAICALCIDELAFGISGTS